MTTIAPAQNPAATLAAQFGGGVEGKAFIMAAGVFGQFFKPLGAGPLAFAALPQQLDVRAQTQTAAAPAPTPVANWTVQTTGRSTANIDLGDGYKLAIDERNSQMTILNEKTGQTTRVWGDPHVEVNGQQKFDFWGTTTFTLDNGTKLTINTEPWGGNPNAYVASQVVITRGDNAIVIDGISQNTIGDLSITSSAQGRALDAAHRDGFTIHEQAGSTGWETEGGRQVTQVEANVTAVGALHGPGSNAPTLAEAGLADLGLNDLGNMLGSFLLFGMVAALPVETARNNGPSRAEARFFRNLALA